MKYLLILLVLILPGCHKFTAISIGGATPEEIGQYTDSELCTTLKRHPNYMTKVAFDELKKRDVGDCTWYYLECRDLGYTPNTEEFRACKTRLWNASAPSGAGGILLPPVPYTTRCTRYNGTVSCVEQ